MLIVGSGIAGLAAAEALRKAAPDARITLVSNEPSLPYYRLNFTRYLAGEVARDELPIHPETWYAEQRIELRRSVVVARLDLGGLVAELRDGECVPFERLILASGAHPFVPPIPGADREGVVSLRTLCLMPSQLDPRAGALMAKHLGKIGVKLRSAVHAKGLTGDRRVAGLALEEGGNIPAELVILATGTRSNTYLARQAGLTVKKGVVVDKHLFTSHPAALAAGDLAEHLGVLYGNWFVAQHQGGIAGMNA